MDAVRGDARVLWCLERAREAVWADQATQVVRRLATYRGYEHWFCLYGGASPSLALPAREAAPVDAVVADVQPQVVVSWGSPAAMGSVLAERERPWIAVVSGADDLGPRDFDALRLSTTVVALSDEAQAEAAASLPGRRIQVCGAGVDTDMFRPLATRESLRRECGLDAGFVVGLWGVGVEPGALQQVVLAFARFRGQAPDAVPVLFLAPGQEESYVSDWERRLGFDLNRRAPVLRHERRNEWWNLLDAVMVSPDCPADGVPSLEMMAAGRVVLGCGSGSEEGRWADRALAELVQLSTDDGARAEAEAAALAVAQAHTWERVAALWHEELVRQVPPATPGTGAAALPPSQPSDGGAPACSELAAAVNDGWRRHDVLDGVYRVPSRLRTTEVAQQWPARGDMVAGAGLPAEPTIPGPALGAPPSARSVRIVTHPGLGDALFAATVAYAVAERGWVPSVGLHGPEGYAHRVTSPLVHALPTLPLLGHGVAGPEFDISQLPSFTWMNDTDMVEAVCADAGVEVISTPRHAMLSPEPWYADLAREIAGTARYVLVAPCGHSNARDKEMTREQVGAVACVARGRGLVTVAVHSEPLGGAVPGVVDLSARLSLGELLALTACARAVVSTDTGVLHLAGAFVVPVVAVLPERTTPRGVLRHYAPCLALEGPTSGDVQAAAVGRGLGRLLAVCDTPWCVLGPDRQTCGVALHSRAVAAAAGAAWRPTAAGAGYCVANYHPTNPCDLTGLVPSHTVVDAHHVLDLDVAAWGGVIVHAARFYREIREASPRTWYIPLPCGESRGEVALPDRPRVVLWHGILTSHKGLEHLVRAFSEVRRHTADARLRLVGSLGTDIADRALASHLVATAGPGVEVLVKDFWSPSELDTELRHADVFCYMDTNDAEQSACSPLAMGYARPVVVSRSTKHDDVRGWVVTAAADLGDVLARLLTDRRAYADAAVRAWQGASYRRPEIVARQYRGAVQQVMLDCRCAACSPR